MVISGDFGKIIPWLFNKILKSPSLRGDFKIKKSFEGHATKTSSDSCKGDFSR